MRWDIETKTSGARLTCGLELALAPHSPLSGTIVSERGLDGGRKTHNFLVSLVQTRFCIYQLAIDNASEGMRFKSSTTQSL